MIWKPNRKIEFVSQKNVALSASLLTFTQAYTRAAAVFINKFDTGLYEGLFQNRKGPSTHLKLRATDR